MSVISSLQTREAAGLTGEHDADPKADERFARQGSGFQL